MMSTSTLSKIVEDAQLIANMVESRVEGVESRPLTDILKDVSELLSGYIHRMARSVTQQVLSFVKSFYPRANLEPMAEGIADDCSDDRFKEIMLEMDPIAQEVAKQLNLE